MINCAEHQVVEYVKSFSKYDFLWKLDMHEEYEKFMKTSPTLEDFEAELKKYMALENEISTITPTHNIECLLLEIQPLKYSLKAEAASWKTQFARKLHLQVSRSIFFLSLPALLQMARHPYKPFLSLSFPQLCNFYISGPGRSKGRHELHSGYDHEAKS